MTLDISKITASQELSNYRDVGDELGQARRHGATATIFPGAVGHFDKTKCVGWIWMVLVMVIGKTLDDGMFLYLFGIQHMQFESGLAVFFWSLVSQLPFFPRPAWDTFQNWLAVVVRHPDCVLQRP